MFNGNCDWLLCYAALYTVFFVYYFLYIMREYLLPRQSCHTRGAKKQVDDERLGHGCKCLSAYKHEMFIYIF